MQELKAHSADLAVKLAEQQLRNRMTPQVQDGLVRGFLQDLEGKAARN